MYKRKRLIVLLIISVLINVVLFYNLNEVKRTQLHIKYGMIQRANSSVDNAANNVSKLVDEWDEIGDDRKIQYLGDIDKELTIAMYSMSDAGHYFPPIKLFREGIHSIEFKILKGVDEEIQQNYIIGLHHDFRILMEFLATNDIWKMSQEDVMEAWEFRKVDLKTEELHL